jgi:hypothetical protein
MLEYLSDPQGWLGVAMGLGMFALGWFRGRYNQNHIETLASIIIDDLIERRMIKTRRTWNQETQAWEIDLLEYDEE